MHLKKVAKIQKLREKIKEKEIKNFFKSEQKAKKTPIY